MGVGCHVGIERIGVTSAYGEAKGKLCRCGLYVVTRHWPMIADDRPWPCPDDSSHCLARVGVDSGGWTANGRKLLDLGVRARL